MTNPKEVVVCTSGGKGPSVPEVVRDQIQRFLRESEDCGRVEELPESSFVGCGLQDEVLSSQAPNSPEQVLSKDHDSTTGLAEIWAGLDSLTIQAFNGLHSYLTEFGIERSLILSTKVRHFSACTVGGHMRLPALTVRNLDLFQFKKSLSTKTLFGLIDKTSTRFGRRKLKDWVSRPLTDPVQISGRQDAVDYLIRNPDVLKGCNNILKWLPDLELALMSVLNLKIRLRDFCRTVVTLDNVSEKLARLLKEQKERCDTPLPALIKETLSSIFRCFARNKAVLSQINTDLARHSNSVSAAEDRDDHLKVLKSWTAHPDVCTRIQEISVLEEGLEAHKKSICRSLGLMAFKYSTVSDMEYLVEVKVRDAKSVPGSWTKVSATKQVVRYRTDFINETLPKLQYARERLADACKIAWKEFLKSNLDSFRVVAVGVASLAKLDALLGMAQVSSTAGFCRPTFNNEGEFTVREGRNLVVESAICGDPDRQYVTNDVDLGGGGNGRALVLTGPNMGGKSCYIRQLAMIAIMGQTGFYVPASSSNQPIFDGVYLR